MAGETARGRIVELGTNVAVPVGDVTMRAGDVDGVVLPQAGFDPTLDAAADRETQAAGILRRLQAGERTLEIFGRS